MKFILIAGLACLFAVVFISEHAEAQARVRKVSVPIVSAKSVPEEDDDDFVPYLGERFNVFDWNLFKAMGSKTSGNLLISPISLKLALVLLYEGAEGQTAHELASTLQLPVSRSATRDKFSTILRSFQTVSPEYTLNLGTKLYIDSGVLTRQRYRAIVKAFYGTDVVTTNLSDTRSIVNEVNSWVTNITHGNIDKAINDGDDLKDSVMLVINALFFKGSWRRNTFSPSNTHVGKFYVKTDETIQVPFMSTIGRFYYSESSELDAQILRIPYQGNKFAMYIVLPRTLNGLEALIHEINPYTLSRHVWLMQDLPIEVHIPKFKFDFTSHMETTLRELGIRDIFDNTATLTGIARTKRTSRHLLVTDILQKTGIEVNENGTTAYAVTEVQVGNKIAEDTFIANRPFLFYIEDETTGTVLYVGKVTNPLEKEGSTENVTQEVLPVRVNDEQVTVPPPEIYATPTADERYNFFNIDLFQAVNEGIEGNVVISPASAKIALTALIEATEGRTRRELLSTLRLPSELNIVRGIAERTLFPLKTNTNGTEIDVTTCLWTKFGLNISKDYANVLQRYYGTALRSIDFADSNNAARTINDWVRQATRNKINAVVNSGSLEPSTRAMITSALYFKGRWAKAFDRKATHPRCFHVPNRGCQNVYLMENNAYYRYGYIASLDAEVVEIPYSDGKTSMLVLLPSHEENDQNLLILSKDLSYIPMSALLASLQETEIILQIPRFNIESKLELRVPLEHLGIRDLFDTTANLSGIEANSNLRVGSILQNAKIEVDEDGTVAAAVTTLSIVPLMGSTTPTFRANRPFLFAIVDLQTNGTLFAGRFMQPNPIDQSVQSN